MTHALRYDAPLAHLPPVTGLASTFPAIVEPLGGADLIAWGTLLAARVSDGLAPAASVPGALVSTLAASLVGRRVFAPVSSSPGASWGLFVVAIDASRALVKLPAGDASVMPASTPAASVAARSDELAGIPAASLSRFRFVAAGESPDGSLWWSSALDVESLDASSVATRPPSLLTASVSTLGALAPTNASGAPGVLVKVSETQWRLVRW